MTKAVFLDRDGVINENRPDHVKSWAEFQFLPGVLDGIARLSQAGVHVFVISNQAIVNRGLVSRDSVDTINQRMIDAIRRRGGNVDAVAYCPHRPEEHCDCRKPQPGLLLALARLHGVDLEDAIVIGDALSDVDAAHAAGCKAILVQTGRGGEQLAMAKAAGRNGFAVAPDLRSAIELLLGEAVVAA